MGNLEYIKFPKSLRVMESGAIRYISSIRAVELQEGLEIIGDSNFDGLN